MRNKMKFSLAPVLLYLSLALTEAFTLSSFRHENKRALSPSHVASSIPIGNTPISSAAMRGKNIKTEMQMSSSAAAIAMAGGGDEAESGGTASIPNEIFNLVKNVVGAGVLSLSAGVAGFGSAPSALIPATFLISSIGIASGYCFSLIGRVCSYTGASTYREAWDKSVSKSSSWLPAASCTAKTSVAILAYSMILADTFQSLLATGGFAVSRSNTLFGVTSLVLLPLCLIKNLSGLAPFSLLGIIGMGYTTLAMAIRYFSGAYKLPDGAFLADVPSNLQPAFGNVGAEGLLDPKSFILICMLSTAYMAHFNAPKFYNELKNNTIKRYNTVVSTSFGISIAIFAAITALGFATFGMNSSGLILNNYSNRDTLMSLSRIAVAVSIVFSYPLAFVGVRDGILDLMNVSTEKRSNSLLNKLTVGILGVVTALALKVKDLSFVLSFGGATLGNALIYVYPAFMFRGAVKNMGDGASKGLKKEVGLAMLVAALGIGMGGIGARMAILKLMSG